MSHEWTDYSQVQNLYANGHEIASHTVTHSHGTNFNEEKWANEVYFVQLVVGSNLSHLGLINHKCQGPMSKNGPAKVKNEEKINILITENEGIKAENIKRTGNYTIPLST